MLMLLSLDHRRSSVAEREPFAIPAAERSRLGRLIRRACGGQVAFLVTCNRVEVVAWVSAPSPSVALTRLEAIARLVSPSLATRFLRRANVYSGEAAALHLLRVAAGLESQVPGDVQVLGQVRMAYTLAAECGSVGAELHRLFQTTLRAGKRVHAETDFGVRQSSVGEAAASSIARMLPAIVPRVAVIGAGPTAASAVRALVARGMHVTILNRTAETAITLAQKFGADLAQYHRRHAVIAAGDAAVVATGALEHTVTAEALRAARLHAGQIAPLLIVDLAVPHNVEPSVARLSGIELLGLEDVTGQAMVSGISEGSLAAAKGILAEELQSFLRWLKSRKARGVAAA
jgi:glutamyl-tRNA reductase